MLTKSFILAVGFSAGIICQDGAAQMDRISPELDAILHTNPQTGVAVIISCKDDCQKLLERLDGAGITLVSLLPELNVISTTINAEQAALFSKDPDVEFIELDDIVENQ